MGVTSPALLVGWKFRSVSNYRLAIKSNNVNYHSESPYALPTALQIKPPKSYNSESKKVGLLLNYVNSRDGFEVIDKNVGERALDIDSLITLNLTTPIENSVHAYSIALESANILKGIMSSSSVEEVHLFPIMPAPLVTLIFHMLNAIKPIKIYFLNSSRDKYTLGGTLTNVL